MPDFSNTLEVSGGAFVFVTESDTVDFHDSGDAGVVTITASAYGEGVYGEGPYGGSQTVTVSYPTTEWTYIDEP